MFSYLLGMGRRTHLIASTLVAFSFLAGTVAPADAYSGNTASSAVATVVADGSIPSCEARVGDS